MIKLSYESGKPIYEQIVEQMKYNIIQGYLSPGDRIPSVRKLALDLQITPNTVAKAYQMLEDEKIIRTTPGKGTYICDTLIKGTNEAKLSHIESNLGSQILELMMLGYDLKDTTQMVAKIYKQLSDKRNGSNEKSFEKGGENDD